ncbi:alpha/beta fold hydrolase [Streptosporangium sp. CA-135522]|uniref:alpha/beta fold hydrolase n=1 Tax=Streptosporangium sp. CA-135522 TaxID=3240072 RepID=UPI003D8E0679
MSSSPHLLHHDLDGPAGAPPLVLGPSLGTSLAVWEPQLSALSRTHRVMRFDLPGHGGSPADLLPDLSPGATSVADLARLVLDLADHHGWAGFHYAGVSLGGAIGAHLALHHPGRIISLAVVCSSARFGEPGAWWDRARSVRDEGTGPLLATAPGRWFAAAGTAATPRGAGLLADLAGTDPAGYAACCDALAGYDLRAELAEIDTPTLVVAGRQDPATPPAHARELTDGIPRASLVEIAGAAHLAGVERPEAVTAALCAHLRAASGGPDGAGGPADARHDATLSA